MPNADNNSKATIIADIYHIRFSLLEFLSLEKNHITSIEPLTRIWMPFIEGISFGMVFTDAEQNHINSIKILKKVDWSEIKSFYFGKYYFKKLAIVSLNQELFLKGIFPALAIYS